MNAQSKKIYWFLILIFIIFSTAFGTVGYFFYKSQERSLKKEKWDQISAIANLKVKQIENWRKERLEDASIIIESPFIGHHVAQFLRNPESRMLNHEVVEWIASIQRRYHYKRVFLLDERGDVRLSSPEGIEAISSHEKKLASQAMEKKKVILSDLYRSETTHLIRMSLLVPILLQNIGNTHPVGALLLQIDPYQFLYPVIQSWPTPSRTSESMLVRREGEEALLLSELGHREGAALTLRFPIKEKQIPITMAAIGQEGIMEGLDYRGVPVLAAIRYIPNSPWSLIAKVDQKEIYGPIRVRAALIGSLVGVLILAAALSVVLLWRGEHAEFQRRKLEAELERRALAEHLDYLTRYANDIVLLMDQDLRILEANERAVESYGYSREELLQLSLSDLRASEMRPVLGSQMRKVKEENGLVLETLHQRKDGTRFPVENSSRLIEMDGKKFYQSIIRDVTERKRAEEALQKSEEKYRLLVENANEAIFVIQDGMLRFFNIKNIELIGYPIEELTSTPFINFVHPEDRKATMDRYLMRLKGEEIPEINTLRIVDEAGNTKWAEINSVLISWEGRPATLNFLNDITEQKQSEKALMESQKRFQELYDNAPVGYFEYDSQGRITNVNRTELEMLGYTLQEMIGQPVWKFIEEEELARQQILAKLAGTLPPARGLERIYRRKDGTTIPLLIEDRLLRDPQGRIIGIRSTIQDITERKRAEEERTSLEEQLRQSQKMEAIGRLAGGIAHDFNNLLTVIEGYSQLSLRELKQDDLLRGNIEEIQKGTRRAADLTRQLLAFGRRQILEMKVLDLNNIIQRLEKMLRRVIGEDVELVTVLADDLKRTKTDQGQIEQVLMNLTVNARDAMPSGGKLTVETANVELDGEYARRHIAVKPGRYVMISVSDTGVGMTREIRERVFEPFFTTKNRDKGTGLGLSTVYGIVKQSGGNIWVYSEPGKGTAFKIYLPRVDEPLGEIVEKAESKELPRGSETVLVVEDEEEVRKLAVRFFERQGYTALEASDGDNALRICREHESPIHLMVADVVMPRMSGRELAERLAPLHPEMKVLYMSGYTDNAIVRHGVLEKGVNFIQKPFTLEGLARKAREVLDKG